MSLVIPPGAALASIVLTGPDGTSPFVTTIGVSTADSGGDYVALANHVMQSYIDAFDTLTSENLSIDKVSLLVGADGGSGSVDSTIEPFQGTRTVDMAPIAMAMIARKVTGQLGRSGRGRMFIPGVLADGDVQQNGQIELASRAIFQAALNGFLVNLQTEVEGITAPPLLLHAEGTDVALPTSIVQLQLAPLVGWIRGRIR